MTNKTNYNFSSSVIVLIVSERDPLPIILDLYTGRGEVFLDPALSVPRVGGGAGEGGGDNTGQLHPARARTDQTPWRRTLALDTPDTLATELLASTSPAQPSPAQPSPAYLPHYTCIHAES